MATYVTHGHAEMSHGHIRINHVSLLCPPAVMFHFASSYCMHVVYMSHRNESWPHIHESWSQKMSHVSVFSPPVVMFQYSNCVNVVHVCACLLMFMCTCILMFIS